MNYEERYKEALERMRHVVIEPENENMLQAIKETVFPELAESEDERIRKIILDAVFCNYGNQQEYLDVYAWLEKQKEQKPAEWSEEDEKIAYTILNLLCSQVTYVTGP